MQTVMMGKDQIDYLVTFFVAIARNKPIEVSSTCMLVIPVVRYGISGEYEVVVNTRLKLPHMVQCDYSVSIKGFRWAGMGDAMEGIDSEIKGRGKTTILRSSRIYRERDYQKLSGQFLCW